MSSRLHTLVLRRANASPCRVSCSARRAYATQPKSLKLNTKPGSSSSKHKHPTSGSLLSQALDQKQSGGQNSDSIGPFALGASSRNEQPQKPWAQLSGGQKVVRGAARTSNFTVILVGGTLFAVLTYALTTELFSKNSPTVLYGQACDKIRDNAQVSRYLHGSLSFHNNAPSNTRPRHRQRHVMSQIAVDSTGREHMLMHFFVAASTEESAPETEASYLETWVGWGKEQYAGLADMSVDEAKDDVVRWGEDVVQSGKDLIRYLSGAPSTGVSAEAEYGRLKREQQEREKEARAKRIEAERSSPWSLAGIFSGLRGAKTGGDVPVFAGHSWMEGEVSADLVRNDDGNFVWRSLIVDIPSSRNRQHRVHVERDATVRNNEPVMRWS